MAPYPRVLVVGQPFDRISGGGITLSNLFEGWPRERLAAAVVSDRYLAFDVCDRYYVLGNREITRVWPLSLVTRTETPSSQADVAQAPAVTAPIMRAVPARGMVKGVLRAAVDGLGLGHAIRTMRLSDPLRDWIRAFRPDVIYSQLSDLPVMTLVSEILRDSNLPLALHMMDDWPSSMYRRGMLAWSVRGHAERTFESLLRRADARMAIGDAMAEEYLRRYGMAFVPIQNAVEIERQDALAALHRLEYEEPRGSPLGVVYAGRVGNANAASLLNVAEAIAGMAEDGMPIRLRLYTSSDHPFVSRMTQLRGVDVRPAVPYDHIPALLANSGVLLMPLDFDDASLQFARLSMPTKIPEYMASGRPVLTYAPRGSAAAEYARNGGWSWLVDEPNPDLIRAALRALLADQALRDAMGARARHLVVERHDATRVRARFVEELARCASGCDQGGTAAGH